MGNPSEIFALSWRTLPGPILRGLGRMLCPLLEWMLGLTALKHLYSRIIPDRNASFAQQILDELQVTSSFTEADFTRIPETGPLAVVANHPFGAVEGLAVLELIRQRRPDVKVMANYLLGRIPELRGDFFLVDPFGAPGSARRNVQALRQALAWLRAGHALIVFPAGEVASLSWGAFAVREAPWHDSVMALLRHIGRGLHILPIFIPGRASIRFQLAGLIHPRLRTLLLPREMLRLHKHTLTLRVGEPVEATALATRFPSDTEALHYLRFRTFVLAGREAKETAFETSMRKLTLDDTIRDRANLIPPVPPEALAEELAALPESSLLFEEGPYELYAAQGAQLPKVLREIGRLRELTFRAVGEGTGRESDTDAFDAAYTQIILWNKRSQEVVGCYRLALSDVLAEQDGLYALYTRSLFRFDERFLGHLSGPAVELGRSFVRPGYQKTFAPLLLLWRGVLTFIAHHPRYTVLFGPVSITSDFRPAARDMLLEHLRLRAADTTLARWVSPRLPPRRPRAAEWRHPDYIPFLTREDDLNHAISAIEDKPATMPVLIRQYLKLGGKIVAFNVDPDFGEVVDGLIVVDLLKAPERDIARYMGKTAYDAYRDFQRKES